MSKSDKFSNQMPIIGTDDLNFFRKLLILDSKFGTSSSEQLFACLHLTSGLKFLQVTI